MSRSEDRPPRLRVLITYDGGEGSQPPRRRRPTPAGPTRPPLRAIAGGSSAPGATPDGAESHDHSAEADGGAAAAGAGTPPAGAGFEPPAAGAEPGVPDPGSGADETTEAAARDTAGRLAALASRETAGRLAALAHELRQMSHRLLEAAQRIDDLVLAMATLEGLADGGPENLLESLERFGLSGEEVQSALALLSLLAEGPDETPDGSGNNGQD